MQQIRNVPQRELNMRITTSAELGQTRHLSIGLVLMAASFLVSGCALNGSSVTSAANGGTTAAIRVGGSVHGGQQPVSGATIQLYTVGTTGNGSTSTPLIASAVTTDSTGSFSITGTYNCTGATQVYIVATQGDSGSGNNTANALMAAVGPCSSLNPSTFIQINELTTVASVYALAPFMADYQDIGSTGQNPAGLVNAFAEAQFLVSTASGTFPTPPAGFTLPTTRLNTLADIIAACINTNGPSSTGCSTVFGATSATDTIGAALAIAQDPGNSSYTALYSLPLGTAPFMPDLTALPNDFTLSVNYTGAELAGPFGVALDANGSAWVTNEAGTSVVKLPNLTSSFATSTYATGGLLAPRGISIDRSGNVWVANTGANNIVELSSAGAALSGSGFGGATVNGPVSIANDSAGNAWVANFYGNSVTELSNTGTPSGSSPVTGSGSLNQPSSIALDTAGRVIVANEGSGSFCLFSSSAILQTCPSDGTLFGASAIAVSNSGAIAEAGTITGITLTGAYTLASNTGAVNSASPVSGGGLTLPVAVAFDGAGTAWFANSNSISSFVGASPDSGSTGLGALNSPGGIAVDASGNLWTANTGDNSVTIFIGLATPVVTPLAANVGP